MEMSFPVSVNHWDQIEALTLVNSWWLHKQIPTSLGKHFCNFYSILFKINMYLRRADEDLQRRNHGVTIQITDESEHGRLSTESQRSQLDGNFIHHRKKIKQIYYDEVALPPEPFFHVDVGAQFDTYFRGQKVRFKEKKAEHFASVVDLDAYEYHKVVFHSFLNEILQSVYFR